MAAAAVRLVRYMDDILVLAPTRWKLRRAVGIVNETLAALALEKHPKKTFIGRVDRGFDFLGVRLHPEGVEVSQPTQDRYAARRARLEERERTGQVTAGALWSYERLSALPRCCACGGPSVGGA
jgi:hypothetical protein